MLGILAPLASSAGTSLLGGLTANKKDPSRLADNAEAYKKAAAGDRNALLYLRQRSGRFGQIEVPGYGVVGGWATDVAKNDAFQKYTSLGGDAAAASGLSPQAPIKNTLDQVQAIAQNAAADTIVALGEGLRPTPPMQATPEQMEQVGNPTAKYVMIGFAVLGVVLLLRR